MSRAHTTHCGHGHALEGDNLIVRDVRYPGKREGDPPRVVVYRICRLCNSLARKMAGQAKKGPRRDDELSSLTKRRVPRAARYISALTPVVLKECQALLAEAMHRERQRCGAKGGRPRKSA
jgi:hypothetical protein